MPGSSGARPWLQAVALVGLLVAVALGVLVGTRPRAPGLETAPPPAAEETPTTTTGPTALPSGLGDRGRWVSYEPQADLRLPRLARAAAGRSFAFEVLPFGQDTSGAVSGDIHVERGAESVAAAIALQLERGGFPVGVRTARAPGQQQDRRIDLDLFVLTATFSGKVRFTVSRTSQAGGDAPLATAALESSVALTATNGRLLYMRRIRETEAAGDGLGSVSERERAAARAVLRKWIRTLFGDARLEAALVGYVSGPAAEIRSIDRVIPSD